MCLLIKLGKTDETEWAAVLTYSDVSDMDFTAALYLLTEKKINTFTY